MIYPLNQQIENLMASFVNEETGEVIATEEEMQKAIADCEMDFDKKIMALRNSFLETELNAETVAAEAKVLRDKAAEVQKRANSLHNRAERIKGFLAFLLDGEKFEKDGARISYRKSEVCSFADRFVAWAKQNRPEFLDMKIRTADVKAALKAGDKLSYVTIEERRNIQIK